MDIAICATHTSTELQRVPVLVRASKSSASNFGIWSPSAPDVYQEQTMNANEPNSKSCPKGTCTKCNCNYAQIEHVRERISQVRTFPTFFCVSIVSLGATGLF